ERTITDLLVEQVEFADVLVLNKCDLISPQAVEQLEKLLCHLNPNAHIIRTTHGQIPPETILNTGRFKLETAESFANWLVEPRYAPSSETEEYGVSSFVYRADRPFHPKRLWTFLEEGMRTV